MTGIETREAEYKKIFNATKFSDSYLCGWPKGTLSTPNRFLDAVERSSENDPIVLLEISRMNDGERREWLNGGMSREMESCERDGRDFIDAELWNLDGSNYPSGNLHTEMLPVAARLLLARQMAASVGMGLALAAPSKAA
ncbi:hypothetical protein [Mesorhizobium sp. A623]